MYLFCVTSLQLYCLILSLSVTCKVMYECRFLSDVMHPIVSSHHQFYVDYEE